MILSLPLLIFGDYIPFLETFRKKITPESPLYQKMQMQHYEKAYELNHYDRVKPSLDPRIPKIIHIIWLGSPLPKRYQPFVNSWKTHHPEWEFKLWTDADIGSFPLVTGEIIHTVKNYGQKSDILRYEILNQFGGLYVDTDFLCLKPHDILHHTCDFYTGMNAQIVFNGNIGSAPGHPIIKSCLDKIKTKKHFFNNYSSIMYATGPNLFMQMILHHIKQNTEGVIVYPTLFFYNFPIQRKWGFWRKRRMGILKLYAKKESFALHAWALSWTKRPS